MPLISFLKALLGGLFAVAIIFLVSAELGLIQGIPKQQNLSVLRWFTAEEWIAIFTGILAIATIFLWISTQRLLRHGRHSSERQLRAYVYVTDIKIINPLGVPKVVMRFKNFAPTPAYDLSFWINGQVREHPLTGPLLQGTAPNSPTSDLSPTGALATDLVWDGPTMQFKERFENRTLAIYIFGRINYKDTFGNRWFTEFRFIEGGEFPFRPEGGDIRHATGGNKAT